MKKAKSNISKLRRANLDITLLSAKWLDPECHAGCQSLVLKGRIERLEAVISALVRLWRSQAKLSTKHVEREKDRVAKKGMKAYASGLMQCADQLSEMLEDLAQ